MPVGVLQTNWIMSPYERSEIMRKIRGVDTTPETSLRRALWSAGVKGWRLHSRQLPGKPDLIFTRSKLAVFVDGCFWHGCPQCYRRPNSSNDYWDGKLAKNIDRDKSNTLKLVEDGWSVLRLWEHEIVSNISGCVSTVSKILSLPQLPPGILLPVSPVEFRSILLSHGWHSLKPFMVNLSDLHITIPFDLPFGQGIVDMRTDTNVCLMSVVSGDLNACRHVASSALSLDRNVSKLRSLATGHWQWISKMQMGRFLRSPSLFEDCSKALFATNTHFTRTVTMSTAATALGNDVGGMNAFPRPERLLALNEDDMRVQLGCGFRAKYLRSLCNRAVERSDVYLGNGWRKMMANELRSELSGLFGFGPSSVDYISRIYYPNNGYHLDSWVLARCRSMFGIETNEVDPFIRRRYKKFKDWGSTVMWLELTRHWHDGPPPTPNNY